ATGHPLLTLLWPAATYTAFLLHPRLRPHLTTRPTRTTPLPWAWFLGLTVVYLTGWSAFTCFRVNALTWPEAGWAHVDTPFSLALIGELRHHMPPDVPMVAGEPLSYHWFVYAHFAASSWITGIEPATLLLRLGMLPMLVAFAVLVGVTGLRVTGSRVGAALAVAGTLFVAAPSLYAGANGLLRWTGVMHVPWNSPTQTFGALLFAPVVLVLMDLLVRPRGAPGRWVLLVVLVVAVMGAKATYLPLLAAGLVAVAAAETLRRRRAPWPAVAALGVTLACLAFAQSVLFGHARQGTTLAPLSVVRATWKELAGVGDQVGPTAGWVLGLTLVYVACWGVTWCGTLGLLARPRLLLRPPVTLMLGMTASGAGMMLLLGSPDDLNQPYFLQACYPYLAVLSAYGLLVVARRERPAPVALVCAAVAGIAVALAVRVLCDVEVPLRLGEPDVLIYLPFAVLLVVLVSAAGLLVAARRHVRFWALFVTMVMAAGTPAAWQARVLTHLRHGADSNLNAGDHPAPELIPSGALSAARWLRAHSGPDDLVATNAHCRWGYEHPCDARHFWVSALTERRVLVEGWAYTAANLDRWRPGRPYATLPFWDRDRVRAGDAVFSAPSAASVALLRERYGVRWLVADERLTRAPIGRFARLELRYGDYAVYRLTGGPGS
ncbi:hypothetical protein ACFO8L_29655, partial [Sphaerisporangium corydalis]